MAPRKTQRRTSQGERPGAERALLACALSRRAGLFWEHIDATTPDDYATHECRLLRRALDDLGREPAGIGSVEAVVLASGGRLTPAWVAGLIDESCATVAEAEVCRDAIIRARTIRALERAVDSADPVAGAQAALEASAARVAAAAPDTWPGLESGQQLLEREFPPREPLLGQWLYPGDRMLLHGPRGSGKSHIAMSNALACSAGRQGPGLFGWSACGDLVPTLYLDFELGPRRLQRILASSVYATWPATAPTALHVCSSCKRVCDADGLASLDRLIEHVGARVVVVDSQTFAFSVESENDAGEWQVYADWINALSAREITYIGLGHDGRAEGHVRGTSAREDSLDLVLSLEKKNNGAAGIDVVFGWTKTRGLRPGDAPRLRVQLGDPDAADAERPMWCHAVDEPERPARSAAYDERVALITELSAQGLQQLQIAERLGISRAAVSRALKRGSGDEK
jgi:hypothetical protein